MPPEHMRLHPCDQGRGTKPAQKTLRLADKIIRELFALIGREQITTA